MRGARITISFTSYWLAGEGAAAGQDLDAQCHRDTAGCPAMPMTQVKGTLKESARRLVACGAMERGALLELFGDVGVPGKLAWRGSAKLGREDQAYFLQNADARAQLFRVMRATAIDRDRGVAKEKALRAVEAAVPMELQGEVHLLGVLEATPDWLPLLDGVCAATLAFGKLKSDGFGRALARAEPLS